MSGELKYHSSNYENNLSNDNEQGLQQILIEESQQRYLNCMRLLKLKQAKLQNKHRTKKISVAALMKQFNDEGDMCSKNLVVIDLVKPNIGMFQVSFVFLIFDIRN